MNSGATAERVYTTLKQRIMAREFRPGDRLDPSALSETMSSSVTPVRDALHVLSGEGLVETRHSDGFHMPRIDPPGLQDLYHWNAEVLLLAVRAWKPVPDTSASLSVIDFTASADATAALFATIGRPSVNVEHRRAIGSANDRLHAVRHAEVHVITGIGDELAAFRAPFERGSANEMRRQITAYHRRRHRAAAEIVRTLYRNGGTR